MKKHIRLLGVSCALLVVLIMFAIEYQRAPLADEAVRIQSSIVSGTRQDRIRGRAQDYFDLTALKIPASEILNGGPGVDGIPSISNPRFILADQLPLKYKMSDALVVTVNGETRAYSKNIMIQHECVNDVIGGKPVAIIYCPLCDSYSVVSRAFIKDGNQQVLSFGISGFLYQSNVLLYDRQTRSLWSQIGMQSVSGPYAGIVMESIGEFKIQMLMDYANDYPQGQVMDWGKTGFQRNYDRKAYSSYFKHDRPMFSVRYRKQGEHRLKEPMVIVTFKSGSYALPEKLIAGFAGSDGLSLCLSEDLKIHFAVDKKGSVIFPEPPKGVNILKAFRFSWLSQYPKTVVIRDLSHELICK